jgi:hypothetical protein
MNQLLLRLLQHRRQHPQSNRRWTLARSLLLRLRPQLRVRKIATLLQDRSSRRIKTATGSIDSLTD